MIRMIPYNKILQITGKITGNIYSGSKLRVQLFYDSVDDFYHLKVDIKEKNMKHYEVVQGITFTRDSVVTGNHKQYVYHSLRLDCQPIEMNWFYLIMIRTSGVKKIDSKLGFSDGIQTIEFDVSEGQFRRFDSFLKSWDVPKLFAEINVGVQEPTDDPRIYNRRRPDGIYLPLSGFFEPESLD